MSTGITILLVFIAVVVTLLIAVPVTRKIAVDNKIKQDAEKIGTAEEKARNIIDEALKTAETKKREALLEAKEESLRTKNEVEKETRERRAELQKYEKRVLSKEESVDKKADVLERRENEIAAKEASVRKKEKEVDGLHEKGVQELERISGFTSEEAKEYLLKSVEDEVKIDTAKLYKELESRAKEEAGRKAKEYVVTAIQKCAVDHVSESTISVVQLPSDEMKGRIIGREGRNIRTLETMTGVDLIIDDTPEAVVLSSFDPIRREVARIALEKLIVDGRIHPARIEEMVEKARKEVEQNIREEGEAAALEVGVHGLHPELIRLLGRMKFRSSYGQNALKHSIEVAQLSGLLAGEVGCDVRMAKRAGLLHDIGKPETLTVDEDGTTHFHGHPAVGEEMARRILRRLRFDNDTVAVVTRLVRYHDYGNDVTPDLRIVRRAVNKIGEDIFPLLFPVRQADILAQSDYLRAEKLENLELWKKLYEEMLEKKQCVSLKTLAVTGRDLIAMGMKPGRELGDMLQKLLELVLEHPEQNTREQLLEKAGELAAGKE